MNGESVRRFILSRLDQEDDFARQLSYARLFAAFLFSISAALLVINMAENASKGAGEMLRHSWPEMTGVAISAAVLLLLQKRPRQWAINLFISGLLLFFLSIIALRGGVSSPGTVAIPLTIFLAGFLISSSASIYFGVASTAAVILVACAEGAGWFSTPIVHGGGHSPLENSVMLGSLYIITAFTTWVFAEGFRRRKVARESLLESEERYRILINASPEAITTTDLEGRITSVSRKTMEFWGAEDPLELIGKSALDLIDPSDHERARQAVKRTLADGLARNLVYTHLRKDGSKWDCELNAALIRDAEGRPKEFIATVRDITDRQRMERALRQSVELYRSLAETAQDSIFVIDRELKVQYVNEYGAKQFGREPADIIGEKMEDLFPPKIYQRQLSNATKVFETGEPLSMGGVFSSPDGDRWFDTRLAPIRDDDGQITRLLGVSREITDHKEAEEELRESRELYSNILESMSDGILVLDDKFHYQLWNKAMEKIYETPREKLVEKPLCPWDVFPHLAVEGVDEMMKKAMEGERAGKEAIPFHLPGGKSGHTSEVYMPLKAADGSIRGVVGVIRDITEKKLTQEALKESETNYRSIFDGVSDIVAVHDLNTGRLLDVNERVADILGYTREECLKNILDGIVNVYAPDYTTEKALEFVKKSVAGETQVLEWKAKHKSGYPVWMEISSKEAVIGGKNRLLASIRDISKRKLAEKALQESEEKYRVLIEALPLAVVILQDNKVAFANQSCVKMLGFEKMEDFVGIGDLLNLGDLDKGRVAEMAKRFQENKGGAEHFAASLKRADGLEFPVEIYMKLISYKGRPAIQAIGMDISERLTAENAIREREQFLSNIFASIQDGISILDTDYTVLRVNKTMERWYSHAAPLVGKKCYEAYHGQGSHCDVCPTRKTIETGDSTHEIVPKKGPGGEIIGWLDLYTFPLFDETSKQMSGVIEYVRDITEQRKSEEELKLSEERYRTLFEYSPASITLLELDGNIIDCNDATSRLTGLKKEEIIGKPFQALPTLRQEDLPDFMEKFTMAVKGDPLESFIMAFNRMDGEERWLEVYPALFSKDGQVYAIQTISVDITERKRAEEEQKQLRERLILSDRMASLGQLVLGIAHEFNNLLGGLRGYSQVAMMPGKEQRLNELPEVVIRMVDNAKSVTENLLGFSERFTPVSETVRPAEMVNGIIRLMKADLETAGIKVKNKVPADIALETDGSKLQQALLNLILNARHAMPDGGTLSFNLKKGKKTIKLQVSDTGMGISDEALPHIFEPFYTTKGVLGGSDLPGTGLGLSLSYGIMQSLGGNIEVKSKPGKGSSFTLTLKK